MDGGHPIKPVAVPPSEPAGQPVVYVATNARGDEIDAVLQARSPQLIEETLMDSVSSAEHFNQEAIGRAVLLAEDLKHAELRAAQDRFTHHPPTSPQVIRAHERARENGSAFATWLLRHVPPCPERERALDAIDLATMHANAAIARTQLEGVWFTEEPRDQANL